MAHRFGPPSVDPGAKPRMRGEVRVKRRLVDDRAARVVDEDRIFLHLSL